MALFIVTLTKKDCSLMQLCGIVTSIGAHTDIGNVTIIDVILCNHVFFLLQKSLKSCLLGLVVWHLDYKYRTKPLG